MGWICVKCGDVIKNGRPRVSMKMPHCSKCFSKIYSRLKCECVFPVGIHNTYKLDE